MKFMTTLFSLVVSFAAMAAAHAAEVLVSPASVILHPGATTVSLQVRGDGAAVGVETELAFDPTALQFSATQVNGRCEVDNAAGIVTAFFVRADLTLLPATPTTLCDLTITLGVDPPSGNLQSNPLILPVQNSLFTNTNAMAVPGPHAQGELQIAGVETLVISADPALGSTLTFPVGGAVGLVGTMSTRTIQVTGSGFGTGALSDCSSNNAAFAVQPSSLMFDNDSDADVDVRELGLQCTLTSQTEAGVLTCTETLSGLPSAQRLWNLSCPAGWAQPLPQVIDFPQPPDRFTSAAPFALAATGGASGNPVTFASLTAAICSVSASVVTVHAEGTCRVRADQFGNASYLAAEPVLRSFAVVSDGSQQPQVIEFVAPSNRTLGDPPVVLSATGGGSGNPVVFASLTSSVCTTSGSNGATVTLVATGTCTVRATQAGNSGYLAAAPVDRSFAVFAPPRLSGLTTSAGTVVPVFDPERATYGLVVPSTVASLTLTPTANRADASIHVNAFLVASATASPPLTLVEGNNVATVLVAAGGSAFQYRLTVLRLSPDPVDLAISVTRIDYVNKARKQGAQIRDYMIEVVNTGSEPAQGVHLQVPIPVAFVTESVSWECLPPAGACDPTGADGMAIDTRFDLPPQQTAKVMMRGTVKPDAAWVDFSVDASTASGAGVEVQRSVSDSANGIGVAKDGFED